MNSSAESCIEYVLIPFDSMDVNNSMNVDVISRSKPVYEILGEIYSPWDDISTFKSYAWRSDRVKKGFIKRKRIIDSLCDVSFLQGHETLKKILNQAVLRVIIIAFPQIRPHDKNKDITRMSAVRPYDPMSILDMNRSSMMSNHGLLNSVQDAKNYLSRRSVSPLILI